MALPSFRNLILGDISTFAPVQDASAAQMDSITSGCYRVSTADSPFGSGAGLLLAFRRSDTYTQIFVSTVSYVILKRWKSGASNWKDWYKFTVTAVQ